MPLQPYKHWIGSELKDTLITHISRMELDAELQSLWVNITIEAFRSNEWIINLQYNGCTAVQDYYHPCPACFVHDYTWICGHGSAMSDRIFYHLMIAEGMTKTKALKRWLAVRVGWLFYYQWKYIKRRKWKQPTEAMIELDKYFNR